MFIELTYHRWSPEYRHEDPIEDPLHRIGFDVDAGNPVDRAARQRRMREVVGEDGIDMIERHRRNHARWTWRYSTHKNLHVAAVNGILAGGMIWEGGEVFSLGLLWFIDHYLCCPREFRDTFLDSHAFVRA